VRATLDAHFQVRETLLDGFQLALRIVNDKSHQRRRNDKMHEGDAEDAPFVGYKRDHPCASFRVNRDTFIDYFVVVHLLDGDLSPFGLLEPLRI